MTIRRSLRCWALIAVVLAMVVAAGVVALLGASRATASQASVHRSDRLALANSLATLAAGYFGQLGASELQAAQQFQARVLALPPAQEPDALSQGLQSLPGGPTAVETGAGGQPTLVGPGAEPLAAALPGIAASIRSQLASGGMAITSVQSLGGHPTVMIAVPVAPSVLVVAYRLDLLPIAAYVAQLKIGPGAVPYLVDDTGRLVTSPVTSEVGQLAPGPVRAEVAKVSSAAVVQAPGSPPQVVAVVPAGIGHWHLVIVQPAPQFYGALWYANSRFRWLLLGVLIVVAAALLWFHARRQGALHAVAEMAVRDPLTGLPNRVAFTKALARAMERHSRDGAELALLFCDLDGFKAVNDDLGHDSGDLLLVAAAERIRAETVKTAGQNTTIARLGGDEFTVLLHGKHARERTITTAQAITDAIAYPFVLGADEVIVGISVGVAYAQTGRDLLRDADLAMYRMKAVRRSARKAGAPDRYVGSL